MNLNSSDSDSENMEKGIENFGVDDLTSIATKLVNKEYKTPFERRLLLGLMSRDYNLYDDIDKNPKDPEDLK